MTRAPRKLKDNQRRSVPDIHKNGELAVFYNLAYNRTSNFIKTIQRKDKVKEFTEIRQLFFPKHAETGNQKEKISFKELDVKLKGLTERTYSELKVFFWNTPKGKNIRYVTPEEIGEINHILLLLLRLRDYHSHYWHEETATFPTNTARIVLDRTFNVAVKSYQPKINFAIDVTPANCWDEKNSKKLSTLGINFFLSFFLTRGQLELFMKSRQYLNRGGYDKPPTREGRSSKNGTYLFDSNGRQRLHSNGTPRSSEDILDLEKSRFIVSFYAQRDAAESAGYWLGKHSLFGIDVLQYHTLQVRNYLESLPTYLHEELSENNQLNQVCRISEKPTALLAASIAHLLYQESDISWRVYSDDVIRKKVSHETPVKEDLQKIPEAYFTTKASYVQQLGIHKVVADRLQHETETIQAEEVQVQQELYENANRIMIRVEVSKNTFMHFIIGHENLKHWGALVGSNKADQSIQALKTFAKDFMSWLQYLKKPSKRPFFLNNSYLKHFNGEKNADGSCKYSSLLPKILLQLQGNNVSEIKAMNVLRDRIQQKITRIIDVNNHNHFAALVQKYNGADYCTGYFEKKEQEHILTKINTIKNKIKAKEATDLDLAEKARLEREWKGKTKHNVRHEKMQLIYKSIHWILGKQGKFTSSATKKQFAKYCYLLDNQQWKKENKALIADWLNVACTAKQNLKKHENDVFEIYQKKVLKILDEAISFDNCFQRITQIAIDKYKAELLKIDTYDNYVNLIGLARRLDIPNPSNEILSNTSQDNKHKTRRSEILAPFYKSEDNVTNGYLHLPHDFFLIAPETRKFLKEQFKNLPNTKKTLENIKDEWLKIESRSNYQTYFLDFQATNIRIKTARANRNEKEVIELKAQRQKIKQLYQDVYTDTVLTLLQGRLLQTDARLPIGWKEEQLKAIQKSHLKEENENESITLKQPQIIKTFDGVTVSFPLKQLKSNDFYNVNRIEAIVKRLKKEQPDKKNYEYKDIKTSMQLHWKESIWFVSQLLLFEKYHKKDISHKNDLTVAKMGYASFDAFERDLGSNFEQLSNVRNKALHADILPPEISYTELTNKIIGFKKRPKKRSKHYKKW